MPVYLRPSNSLNSSYVTASGLTAFFFARFAELDFGIATLLSREQVARHRPLCPPYCRQAVLSVANPGAGAAGSQLRRRVNSRRRYHVLIAHCTTTVATDRYHTQCS